MEFESIHVLEILCISDETPIQSGGFLRLIDFFPSKRRKERSSWCFDQENHGREKERGESAGNRCIET